MGDPVVLVRLGPDTLDEACQTIVRLRQIGEEAAGLREALSDMFTAALEEAGLVQ